MKGATLLTITLFFCSTITAHSQDLGYNTKDIGLEYIWVRDNPSINLQVALNAKIHHSFIASIGYKEAWRPITTTHNNEKGTGFASSVGYRYYFKVIPKGIYLGLRAHVWSLSMYKTANLTAPKDNLIIGQPAAEIGYTALLNDLVFLTIYYSAGKQFQISAADNSYGYGKAAVSAIGISGGIRF